jgi:hypothetical protein
MGRIVVAAYKPLRGKEAQLEALVATHVDELRAIGLATSREPIVARASDGTILEVFEWVSEEAIATAHEHPAVLDMWQRFEACCTYEIPSDVPDLTKLFISLQPL